jgi:hypothetical protein
MAFCGEAQITIHTSFQPISEQEKSYWQIMGETYLPNGTLLRGRLLFQKIEIPNSRFQVRVWDQKFFYKYGTLAARTLSGTYILEITYAPGYQPHTLRESLTNIAAFTQQKPFYIGTQEQEQQEIQDDHNFYQSLLHEIKLLVPAMEQKKEFFLQQKPPLKPEEMQAWSGSTGEQIAQLAKKLNDRKYPAVLASRWMENLADAGNILALANILWQAHKEALYQHYGLSLPTAAQTKKPHPANSHHIDPALLLKIPDKDLGEKQLEQYTVWFDELFVELRTLFASLNRKWEATQKLDETKWQENSTLLRKEMAEFKSKISDFGKSPLLKKYPNLPSLLTRLEQNWQALMLYYTAYLYRQAKLPIPSQAKTVIPYDEIMESLENDFSKLSPEEVLGDNRGHISPEIELYTYEAEIAQIAQKLLRRLSPGVLLGEAELEQDLLWFNQLFATLAKEYQSLETKFNEAQWKNSFANFQKEMDSFKAKVSDYKKSPLTEKHPSLVASLESLEKNGRNLAFCYASQLYKTTGIPIPLEMAKKAPSFEVIMNSLREEMGKVYNIVQAKRQLAAEKEAQSWELIKKSFPLLLELNQKFEEQEKITKDPASFARWCRDWNKQVDALSEAIDTCQMYFPGIHTKFSGAIYWLQTRATIHTKHLKNEVEQNSLEVSLVRRRYNLNFRIALKELEAELRK